MLSLVTLTCLSLNVYHEARGEPDLGQLAVAYVTLNRARRHKRDVCDVVFEPYQFSWTTRGVVMGPDGWTLVPHMVPTDRKALDKASHIAKLALSNSAQDPTQGALFYHATYVSPSWKNHMIVTAAIGQHVFYHHDTATKTMKKDRPTAIVTAAAEQPEKRPDTLERLKAWFSQGS